VAIRELRSAEAIESLTSPPTLSVVSSNVLHDGLDLPVPRFAPQRLEGSLEGWCS